MAISEVKSNKVTTSIEDVTFAVSSKEPKEGIFSMVDEAFTTVELHYANDKLSSISIKQMDIRDGRSDGISLYFSNRPESLLKLGTLREALNKTYELLLKDAEEGRI